MAAQYAASDVRINYTYTDEAPMLATYSLLPVLRAFCNGSGVQIVKKDISLAGRVKALFSEYLHPAQRVDDELEALGELAKTPVANIIKLPNISASIPQLNATIKELQSKGLAVPDYPSDPKDDKEKEIQAKYKKVLGSAVNPVLREGNSDRRAAKPVKLFAQENPHKVAKWTKESKAVVAHMSGGDFFGSEKSAIMKEACSVRIELVTEQGTEVLKAKTALLPGEIIDGTVMHVAELRKFLEQELQSTEPGVLWSLHVKATMMKVSDPIIFGHAVEVFYKAAFEKHQELFRELGVKVNDGLGDVYAKINGHPKQAEIEADLAACYDSRPPMAMVDSSKGITNLHVPSDVIIDASMAAAIRDGGKMWTKDDTLCDTKFVIPDRCYAGIYDVIIKDCQENGAFDVKTMGATSNVGLMAAKAEEYGSHDKTFQVPKDGKMQVVVEETGEIVFAHDVSKGDIWRMCQTKDIPVQDWVKLAVARARSSGTPAIFWLTEQRAHDRNVIAKVQEYLKKHDTSGLDIQIMSPEEAMKLTVTRARAGQDTISVTGNVLRDYLTDLFPILELGTSAKMLSIVPLLAGGGLFETGAGGSAPKHVQQFEKEGHLRWDSLGEFLAFACSLEDVHDKTGSKEAKVLADTLNDAVTDLLRNNKSPGRKVKELDNRGSHFYLALYWAQKLAGQTELPALRERFAPVAEQLKAAEEKIVTELRDAEGKAVNVGGYYDPDDMLATAAMRPSATFNSVIDALLSTTC